MSPQYRPYFADANTIVYVMRAILFALACCVAVSTGHGWMPDPEGGQIQPDVRIQEQIGRTVAAFVAIDRGMGARKAFGELETLDNLCPNEVELIRQLIYFKSRATEGAPVRQMFFYLGYSKREFADALVPYFDSTDARLRDEVRVFLRHLDGHALVEEAELFEHYLPHFSEMDNPPIALAESMYDIAPHHAMVRLTRRFATDPEDVRQIKWSDHVCRDYLWRTKNGFTEKANDLRDECLAELSSLSERPQWWVRLYVAEIIRKHRELRTPELLELLSKDESTVVKKSLARF